MIIQWIFWGFLAPQTALAVDLYLRYMIHAKAPLHSLAGGGIGIQWQEHPLLFRLEGGFLRDKRVPNTVGYTQLGVGIEPRYHTFYVQFVQSIGAVSADDRYLSGVFQFFLDAGIGIRNKSKALGIGWKHISNAGIARPNIGKDLLTLQILLSF